MISRPEAGRPDPLDPAPLDAADPLAGFRGRFVVAEPDLIYLDGNSLGRLPRRTAERLERLVREEWGRELIRGWDHWMDLPTNVGDRIAAAVVGARSGEVLVGDSTTVSLFRLVGAAVDARPDRRSIVAVRNDFPTVRYVVEGTASALGRPIRWVEPDPSSGPSFGAIQDALDDDVGLLVLSLAHYRSAAIADLSGITAAAHDAGALVLWDLSHAVGAIPIDLEAGGVDLAVGCTYKYLNAGPGAPAFLYVRTELQERLRPPIQGWIAARDVFAMAPEWERAPGILGFGAGTPPVLGLVAVDEGVALVEEAGIDRIRAKSVALTRYAVDLHDAWLAPLGTELGSPRDADRRGSHVAIRHPDAERLTATLAERGVIVDFRRPDVLRLGLSPLTTTFAEVREAIVRLRDLLATA
jgi:kynureninase